MSDALITFLIALPAGTIIGWFAKKLLTPTLDGLGNRFYGWLTARFSKDEYATYVSYSNIHKLIVELHTKNGYSFFNARKPYLNNHSINLEIKSKTKTQLGNIINLWIKQVPIDSYDESNIFFAGLELLLPNLTKEHIKEVYEKHCENNQANLWVFLEDIEKRDKELLSANILDYIHQKQKEYEDLYTKNK